MADKTQAVENKPGYFQSVKAEFKKIIWPSRQRAFKQTGAVVVVSVVLGVILAVIDWIIKLGLGVVL